MRPATKPKITRRQRRVPPDAGAPAQAPDVPRLLTVRETATAMSVQPGQVRRWIEDGCPVAVKGGPGKSALLDLEAVKAWRAERRVTTSVAEAGADLKRVQTRRVEMDLRRRAGELLERADVERVWAQHIVDAKRLLESLPRALAPRLVAEAASGGALAVERVLTDEIRKALVALGESSA